MFEAADIALINGLADLERVDLSWMKIDDAQLSKLRLPKVRELVVAGNNLTDESLEFISRLCELRALDLSGNERISGKTLKKLVNCPKLETLILRKTGTDDDGVIGLAGCKSLRAVDLERTRISDKGFAKLELPTLEELNLSFTNVSALDGAAFRSAHGLRVLGVARTAVDDDALARIAHLTKLERLDLTGTLVNGPGLAHLKNLGSLRHLELAHTDVDDMGLKSLLKVQTVEVLRLESNSAITDLGVKALGGMTNLKELWIGSRGVLNQPTAITDDGVRGLVTLKKLRELKVIGVEVKEETIALFKKTNPGLRLEVSDP